MKQYTQDRIIAAVGMVGVILGLWEVAGYEEEGAFFPAACFIALGVLLIILTIDSFLVGRKASILNQVAQMALSMKFPRFVGITSILGIYVGAVEVVGFYVSSAIFLAAVGVLWGGVKKSAILLFTVVLIVFLYVCFTLIFNVPLPSGIAR
jgi:hypothetical protein